MQRIILASGSPRRKEIMTRLGLEYEVSESGFDEASIQCEEAHELVEELALQKALSVALRQAQGKLQDAVVVGGDTVVTIGGEILGKADSEEQAREMLNKLIGQRHEVVTGVAVVNTLTGERVVGHESGWVQFRDVVEEELDKYIEEGKWRGFAGCYAIQGGAKGWVIEQSGVLSAIIGMPVELTTQLLEEMGIVVGEDPKQLEIEIAGEEIGL